MLSRKFFGFMGATWLGSMALLISPIANAVIDLDMTDKSMAAVTYAKETLTTSVKGKDRATYYVVGSSDAADLLIVQAGAGIAVTKEALVVEVMLDGMVFNTIPMLTVEDAGTCPVKVGDGLTTLFTLRQGGAEGDNRAAFYMTSATTDLGGPDFDSNPRTKLCLYLSDAGISAGAAGGITMNVRDTLTVLPSRHSVTYRNAIRAANALKETPAALTPTASVANGFMSFGGDLMASVGSLWLTYEGTYRNAADGSLLDDRTKAPLDEAIRRAETLTKLIGSDDDSSIVFSGDFSFASKVALADGTAGGTGTTCAEEGNDLLQRDEDSDEVTDTMELMPVKASAISTGVGYGKYLCIFVRDPDSDDNAVPIPETDEYMVTTIYAGASANAAFPPAAGMHELGYIKRDGTTVELPYLTTFPDYNQRIVIRNRGGSMAAYTLHFMTEEGAMATAGADAVGMLPANSVIYLSMLYGDVVTLEGTHRVAATLTVVSEPRHIDVLVSQTNEGGTDTVNYTPRQAE